MRIRVERWACLAILLVAVGCDSGASTGGGGNVSMSDLTAQLEGKPKGAAPAAAPVNSPPPMNKEAETPAAADPAAASASREAESGAVPAGAKRASDLGPQKSNPNSYMGAVIGASRNIREVSSDWAWQKSVQLFEASNGRKPRNTKEFLDLVRGEGTPIPELPAGYTYLYVPEEGQFGQLYRVSADQAPAEQPSSGR